MNSTLDLQELDEVTDEMAEAAINGVTKGASSLWNMASGYITFPCIDTDDISPFKGYLLWENAAGMQARCLQRRILKQPQC